MSLWEITIFIRDIGGDRNERYVLPRITFDQDYTASSTHHEWLVLTVRFTSIPVLSG